MELPPDVDRFLYEHVSSVEELEIVLLLHRERTREFTAQSVASELRISAASAGDRLERLVARGIAGATAAGFVYGATGETDAAIALLDASYRDLRFTVLRRIFDKPNDRVQTFADAFRLRRDK